MTARCKRPGALISSKNDGRGKEKPKKKSIQSFQDEEKKLGFFKKKVGGGQS